MNPGQELAPGIVASPVTAGQETVTESRKTLGLSDREDSTGVGLMETIINGKQKKQQKKRILPHAHQDNEFFRPFYCAHGRQTSVKYLLALGERDLGTCQERGLCN